MKICTVPYHYAFSRAYSTSLAFRLRLRIREFVVVVVEVRNLHGRRHWLFIDAGTEQGASADAMEVSRGDWNQNIKKERND